MRKHVTNVAVAKKDRKENYDRRKTLINEAAVEQRAIRDCKKKISRLLEKDPETDISFQEKTLKDHMDHYEEIIQKISYLELDILMEGSSRILNGFA